MSQHGWASDAPSGVYKNHKLSSKIRMAAIAQTRFMRFSAPEPGYGKKMGENVTITRVANVTVPSDDSLNENVRIPEDAFSLSTQAILVNERGRSIPYSSLSLDLASFDLQNAIQSKLRDQLSLSLDNAAATAFKAGQVKAIPDGVASLVFDNDGTPSTQATANLNMYHVEQIRDQMFGVLNIAPFSGDDYVCLLSYKAKRGIFNDPNWRDWQKYTDPSKKFNGEVGRIENIRFVEVNNTSALSASKGASSVLGEAVFFGADPVRMGVVQDPELRAKESEDYGRSKGVAWYGVYGFGQIWSDSSSAGEARVVHLTSS
jgi:N4-gp56 family major capsid protein